MEDPHQRDLRKGRVSLATGLYLVTKNIPSGLSESMRTDVADALQRFRAADKIFLHAFVVMPEHWHILISLHMESSLSKLAHDLCMHASFSWRRGGITHSWQDGFHDHLVRQGESVVQIVRYVEANPVRRRLVEKPNDWRWSSAHGDFSGRLDRDFLGHERWEG